MEMNGIPEPVKHRASMNPRQNSSRRRPGVKLFWRKWMVVVTWGIIAAGVSMAVLPETMNRFFSLLFFFIPDHYISFGEPASGYITFAHGMLGSATAGWGIAMLGVLYGSFREGSRKAWQAIAYSVAVWFTLNTAVSFVYGLWQNAILNLIIAELYVIPLFATFRQFFGKSEAAATQSRKKSQ